MKYYELNEEKAFTKKESNDIINKNNSLSKLLIKFTCFSRLDSCNRYIYESESEGLFMRETEVVYRELKKELTFKEKIIVKIFKKTFSKMYRLGMIKCFNYYNE